MQKKNTRLHVRRLLHLAGCPDRARRAIARNARQSSKVAIQLYLERIKELSLRYLAYNLASPYDESFALAPADA